MHHVAQHTDQKDMCAVAYVCGGVRAAACGGDNHVVHASIHNVLY